VSISPPVVLTWSELFQLAGVGHEVAGHQPHGDNASVTSSEDVDGELSLIGHEIKHSDIMMALFLV
jgi:hypothetical protein